MSDGHIRMPCDTEMSLHPLAIKSLDGVIWSNWLRVLNRSSKLTLVAVLEPSKIVG